MISQENYDIHAARGVDPADAVGGTVCRVYVVVSDGGRGNKAAGRALEQMAVDVRAGTYDKHVGLSRYAIVYLGGCMVRYESIGLQYTAQVGNLAVGNNTGFMGCLHCVVITISVGYCGLHIEPRFLSLLSVLPIRGIPGGRCSAIAGHIWAMFRAVSGTR